MGRGRRRQGCGHELGARGQGPGGARTFPRPLRWWRLGVEETLQKLALRRKKALNAQEMEPDWLRRRRAAPSTPPCSKIRRGRGCELDDPKHFAFLPLPLLESRRPRAELGLEGGDHARPLSLSRLAWARRAPCARRLSLQDPSGPADAARGAPRRPPDAQSVCRAEAAERAPGPCGRVCPHRACLSQEVRVGPGAPRPPLWPGQLGGRGREGAAPGTGWPWPSVDRPFRPSCPRARWAIQGLAPWAPVASFGLAAPWRENLRIGWTQSGCPREAE